MLSKAACEPGEAPGVVASLQTFGSYGVNFHPPAHILCTEGVITPDGRFHPVIWPGKRELEEGLRRRFLALLEKAGRLSSTFHETLLSWRHSGSSVDASQRVAAGEEARLERLARYAARVPLAVGALRDRPGGKVEIDPLVCRRCGEDMVILAWITRPDVVDRILRQRREKGLVSPFEP